MALSTMMYLISLVMVCFFALPSLYWLYLWSRYKSEFATTVPISVNYHLTRRCNYECGFCFHTAKTSYILPLNDAKKGLVLLKNVGMKKVVLLSDHIHMSWS